MKKIITLVLACLSIFIFPSVFAADLSSPLGYWRTIDDVTGKPKSILHIFQSGNTIDGRIVKIFPRPGYDQNEVCAECTGSLHNKRIVGLVIMQGLSQDSSNPNEWNGGTILDPVSGKTYKCMLTVIDGGRRLNARGYLGISMFGRTQTWERVSKP
jgi:uncharacterized protein (DUF2147 family)